MRERVRLWIAGCFYYSGLVKLALWWHQHFRRRLIILNYHRASGKYLRQQLDYLRCHYRLMHVEAALEEFFQQDKTKRQRDTGPLPMALTFDDGYYDNYTIGIALARELQVPITIYLIPGYLEGGNHFWWLEGERLARHAQIEKVTLETITYSLHDPAERKALAKAIDRRARYVRSIEEREAFLAKMRQELAVPPETVTEDRNRPMTWKEIHEMAGSEWISFGAHTMHHPLLANVEDENELRYEVGACRQVLEENLGRPVYTFAYPIGKPEHFGERGVQAVQAAGYTYALTTIEATNTPQTNQYLLGRLPGDPNQHWLIMASELAGLLGILSRLRKKL